jgi:translation initiation factor IF-3
MAQNERKHENRILANREIKTREVRLLDSVGGNLGIVPYFKALTMAEDQGLDLILINSTAQPPVCKIGDVGKYKYEMKKRTREADKKVRENRVDLKEVQLRPGIDRHDLDVKIKHIKEWLEHGDRVKIVIKFRGREIVNSGSAVDLINSIMSHVPNAKIEGNRELQGNRLIATLFQGKPK